MLRPLDPSFAPRDHYDVAIVGTGAAGATIAMELARRGRSVFLAEGGGLDPSSESQALYEARSAGDEYHPLDTARLRYFGGTTGHWGGDCRALDAEDFLPREASADTGWPIRRADLEPFTDRARALLGLGAFPADSALAGTDRLREVCWIYSDPMRFGTAYRDTIAASAAIDGLTDCNLLAIERDSGGITAMRFRTLAGATTRVAARCFVLACGGFENSRILLIANRQHGDRTGNMGGAVGRYWIGHHIFDSGNMVVFRTEPFRGDAAGNPRVWAPSPGVIAEHRILNASVKFRIDPQPSLALVRELAALPELGAGARSAMKMRLGMPTANVRVWWEQEPRADNAVTLDPAAVDALGLPRGQLYSRRSALDRRTARVAMVEAARHVAQQGLGRVKLAPWVADEAQPWPGDGPHSAYHMMGGTRMAAGPDKGVVDSDCRVFGTDNLYVAGSSVFPTGGYANPTFTIVQLALRLSDRLGALLA